MKRLLSSITLLLILQHVVCQDLFSYDIHKFRKEKIFSQKIEVDSFRPDILNAAIFYCTNEIRIKNHLPSLDYSKKLEESATMHSFDMATSDFFNHTNPKNKKHREPEDRAKLVGIVNPHIAENIIEGFIPVYKSGKQVIPDKPGIFIDPETNKPLETNTYLSLADELLRLWMDSPGHKANILSDKAKQIGCGTALFYMKALNDMPCVKATQNFQWFEPVQTN